MTRVAILGGRGYGGMELLRLLLAHPHVEVVAVTSRTVVGPVADVHAHLEGFTELEFLEETAEVARELARSCDVLFQAKPDGISAGETPFLLEADPEVRVVDLSGDFRLKEAALYPRWYGFNHPDAPRLAEVVYGLPECGGRETVKRARLVANPGAHATAAILALWPLACEGLLQGRASITSVIGSSVAGAEPTRGTHHPEAFGNFRASKPLRHAQVPEIQQALSGAAVDLVPCVAPFSRGVHATALASVGHASPDTVKQAYVSAYGDEPCVRLLDAPPELRHVVGSNLADVYVTISDGVACAIVAIDNLGKGGCGTAVQNLNLMIGCPETTSLHRPGAGF